MSDDMPAAMRRRPGRPRGSCKPQSELRAAIVNVRFRVTDAIYDALCRLAVRQRKSVPVLARELLLAQFSVSKKNSNGQHSPKLGA